jgi:hypothetical protein
MKCGIIGRRGAGRGEKDNCNSRGDAEDAEKNLSNSFFAFNPVNPVNPRTKCVSGAGSVQSFSPRPARLRVR